jgi:hypothetical protein
VRPGAEGRTDPVPEARPVAMSKEPPGPSAWAGPLGGPRAGAGPKGRAVDRSLGGVGAGGPDPQSEASDAGFNAVDKEGPTAVTDYRTIENPPVVMVGLQ